MNKKVEDLSFGQQEEEKLIELLRDYFKDSLLIKSTKYCIMDFESPNNEIELKSRRFNKDKYLTTIIGKNKIDYCNIKYNCKDFYFVFNFIDGLYFIKYDKDTFKDFEIKDEFIYRAGKKENKINCHIPVDRLTKLII